MRFWGSYSGSSFAELLQTDHSQLTSRVEYQIGAHDKSVVVPEGTTVLGFKYADGVVVAGDRLATAGNMVASRDVEKVFETDSHSLMAISGAAGPSIEMGRLLSIELEHYEKIEGEALELDGKANRLSQMLRQNLPAAMQGLVVLPLYAGYDRRRQVGRLWKFDVTGGRYEEAEYETAGSGGLFAKDSLKNHWRVNMSRDEAVSMAVRALTDAADDDRATGGIDLQRGIFSIIKLCSAAGIETASEGEIEASYRALIQERSQGRAAR